MTSIALIGAKDKAAPTGNRKSPRDDNIEQISRVRAFIKNITRVGEFTATPAARVKIRGGSVRARVTIARRGVSKENTFLISI